MNKTNTLGLSKPVSTEKLSVAIQNTNMDLLDSAINRLQIKDTEFENTLATKSEVGTHINNKSNPHETNKSHVGLSNVTNDRQVIGLANGTIEDNISVFGIDGYSIKDSGFKAQMASINNVGFTRLEDAVDSNSIDKAATPNAVKITYERLISSSNELSESIDLAYQNSNAYTDQSIANLINGAPEIGNTLKELFDLISENKSLADVLNDAIGKKANQLELDSHTDNSNIHIKSIERTNWSDANDKKHVHDNKSVLDGITETLITLWNNKVEKDSIPKRTSQLENDSGYITKLDVDTSQNHTHSNKSIIDKITQSDLDKIDNIVLASLMGGIDYSTSEPTTLTSGMTWIGTVK